MVVRYLEGPQDSCPLWENVLLVEAADSEAAFAVAEDLARSKFTSGPEDGFLCEDRAALLQFAGIRKLFEILDVDDTGVPGHGSEVTCSELDVSTEQDLSRLLRGESVQIQLD